MTDFFNTIYVKIEGDKGEEYLSASENLLMLVDTGEHATIGIYQLVKVQEVEGIVKMIGEEK